MDQFGDIVVTFGFDILITDAYEVTFDATVQVVRAKDSVGYTTFTVKLLLILLRPTPHYYCYFLVGVPHQADL